MSMSASGFVPDDFDVVTGPAIAPISAPTAGLGVAALTKKIKGTVSSATPAPRVRTD
jgi:hypothetical protein